MWGIIIAATLVVALGFAIIYVPVAIYALFSTIAQGEPVFEGPGDVLVVLPAIIIVGLIVGVPILFILYKKGILYSLTDLKIKKSSIMQNLTNYITSKNTVWVLIGEDSISVYDRDSSTPSYSFNYEAQGFKAPDEKKEHRLGSYIGRHCFGGHYVLVPKACKGYLYCPHQVTDKNNYNDPLLDFRGVIVCQKKYKNELREKLTPPKDPREELF